MVSPRAPQARPSRANSLKPRLVKAACAEAPSCRRRRCQPRSPAHSWPRRRSRRRERPWCDRAGRSEIPAPHQRAGERFVLGRQRHRGRQAARHVLRKARTRQDRRQCFGRCFCDHLGHEFVRAALNALGAGDDRNSALARCGARAATASRRLFAGVVIRIMSAAAARAMSPVTATLASRRAPDNFGLARVAAISAARSAVRASAPTSRPARAASPAGAAVCRAAGADHRDGIERRHRKSLSV